MTLIRDYVRDVGFRVSLRESSRCVRPQGLFQRHLLNRAGTWRWLRSHRRRQEMAGALQCLFFKNVAPLMPPGSPGGESGCVRRVLAEPGCYVGKQ